MKDFFSSPSFLWWAIGITAVIVAIAVLRKNTFWTARGITPKNLVDRLKSGMSWFPKSPAVRWTLVGVIVMILIIWRFSILLSSSDSSPLHSPSLKTVNAFTKDHWLLILLAGGALYTALAILAPFFMKGKEALAKTLQTVIAVIMLAFFIGFPFIGLFTSRCSGPRTVPAQAPQASTSIPLVSMPATEWSKLVLSPGGSGQIPVLYGMQIIADGRGANLHTVYADGRDLYVPIESRRSNPDGQIVRVYVTNRLKETNIVSFAYSKK